MRGLPPLGFLAPFLYHLSETSPQAFNDIVMGDNRCRSFGSGCCTDGFQAGPGWDPVVGLGSPNFPEILRLVGLHPSNKISTLSDVQDPVSSGAIWERLLLLVALFCLLIACVRFGPRCTKRNAAYTEI